MRLSIFFIPIFSKVEITDWTIKSIPSITDLIDSLLFASSEILLWARSILSLISMISFAKFETPYLRASDCSFSAEKEQSDALKYGVSNFAKEIIDIRDNIERAQSSISDEAKSNESIKSVIEGIDLIVQSVISTFEKIGIKKIESLNEKFDHNLHQAMMEIENDDLEPGTIVQELIPGYTLHDRLLRPAMVGVSKKSKKNDDNADKSEPEEIKS